MSGADERTVPGEEPSAGGSPRRLTAVGPYRLLERIGEGGMGEVWRAEQERPVRRIVALKLVKPGMDTRRVIARFASERQTLALMDHPHIARVFDAGATEQGRPYFVMEHVDGEPIDAYCERRGLSPRARLELFLDVCDGVQHAHQKGIIHRDIKPSNVLVREQDGRALPKIIDFGIAKATAGGPEDGTMLTETGQLIGTPEYMSPEQAELGGMDVDTRSDVYSLGVLLYKLLVGEVPFDLREKRLNEIRTTILDAEPERPSQRVEHLQRRAAAAGRTALARRLRGDLDWIVMRALEKDRARRYPSASELAADVRRHLRHEPVLAGPPSVKYKLAKFVRRHKTGVAAGLLVALALVGGTAAATLGFLRARDAEAMARVEAVRANESAHVAGQISAFLERLFELNDPNEARGNSITAREILDRGARQLRELDDQPPLVRARLMEVIGRVYQGLGLYADAGPLLEEALAIRRERLDADHPDIAASLRSLGALANATGDYGQARRLSEEALAIHERALAPDDPELANSLHNLAVVLWRTGDAEGARELYDRAVAIRQEQPDPDAAALARSMFGVADLLREGGEFARARASYEKVLELQQQSLPPDHPEIARTLLALANRLKADGETGEARGLYERALAIKEQAFGPDHRELVELLAGLGDLLLATGDPRAALTHLERSIAIAERTFGADSGAVAELLWLAGGAHRALGDAAASDAAYRRSLAIKSDRLRPDDPTLPYDRACYHALSGRVDEALRELRRALEMGSNPRLLLTDTDLDALRGDPRFAALVAAHAAR